MTAERWRQIELLYHAALEREPSDRTSFLNNACAGDESLRREGESLLAAGGQAGNFIESPAGDLAAGMSADKQTPSMIGRSLGRYQLQMVSRRQIPCLRARPVGD